MGRDIRRRGLRKVRAWTVTQEAKSAFMQETVLLVLIDAESRVV